MKLKKRKAEKPVRVDFPEGITVEVLPSVGGAVPVVLFINGERFGNGVFYTGQPLRQALKVMEQIGVWIKGRGAKCESNDGSRSGTPLRRKKKSRSG